MHIGAPSPRSHAAAERMAFGKKESGLGSGGYRRLGMRSPIRQFEEVGIGRVWLPTVNAWPFMDCWPRRRRGI